MTTTTLAASTSKTRPLGDSYSKNGFHYELILRRDDLAIFKQRLRPGVGCLAYELIRIKVAPATVIMGKEVPEREIAPSNESFGVDGWSYPTLELAKAKMRKLEADKLLGNPKKGKS